MLKIAIYTAIIIAVGTAIISSTPLTVVDPALAWNPHWACCMWGRHGCIHWCPGPPDPPLPKPTQ